MHPRVVALVVGRRAPRASSPVLLELVVASGGPRWRRAAAGCRRGTPRAVSMAGRARVARPSPSACRGSRRAPGAASCTSRSTSASRSRRASRATLKSRSVFLFGARQRELPARRRRSRRGRPSTSSAISRSSAPRASGPTTAMSAWRDAAAAAPGRVARHDAPGRLVAEHAAVVRGIADRRADVAARLDAGQAGGQRRGRAARRAARRAREVPRIVGRAVDRRCSSASRRASAARWSCRTA